MKIQTNRNMNAASQESITVGGAFVTVSLNPSAGPGPYLLRFSAQSVSEQPRNAALVSIAFRRSDGTLVENPLDWPRSKTLHVPYRYIGPLAAGRTALSLGVNVGESIAEVIVSLCSWGSS